MRVLLPLFVVSAGCDAIFDLEHLEPPPDAGVCAAPIGHDEDRDGTDDACDPCPFHPDNEGDSDGDGIAAACDPDPATANEVLVFSGFDPASRASFTVYGGSFVGDSFRATGAGSHSLVWNGPSDNVRVVAGVEVEGIEQASYRETGFVFDARPSATSDDLDGTYCVIGRTTDEDYVEVFSRDPANGMDIIKRSTSALAVTSFRGRMTATYARAAVPSVTCTFIAGDVQPTVSGTRTMHPPAGSVALFAQDMTVSIQFVFVVR